MKASDLQTPQSIVWFDLQNWFDLKKVEISRNKWNFVTLRCYLSYSLIDTNLIPIIVTLHRDFGTYVTAKSEGFSIEKTTHFDLIFNVSLDLVNSSTVLSPMPCFCTAEALHFAGWVAVGWS